MTITIAQARAAEAARRPDRLSFKTAQVEAGVQTLGVDEAEGIVTAIVSVTGVEDEVADIITPGAYRETLTKRRPKVCWAHSWERPIGRVLHVEELLPGDPRLPDETKDGQPWPEAAGALVATMQFNMRSPEGKSAFEVVRFYSESGECEYSIGYQVPPGKATRDAKGVRHIKSLDLYELSVVLFGAHTMTGTLSIKDARAAMSNQRARGGSASAALARVLATKAAAPLKPEGKAVETFEDGVMVALYPDPAAATAVANAIAGPDDTTAKDDLHVTLAYLGKTGELQMTMQEIADAVTEAVDGLGVLEGTIGGIGQFPASEGSDGRVPTWAPVDVPGLGMLREQVVAALGDTVRQDHGFTPHMTLGYDIGLTEPVPETPVRFDHVRIVYGTDDRRVTLAGAVTASKPWESEPEEKGMYPIPDLAGKSIEEVARLTAIQDLCTWRGAEPEVKAEGGADRNRGGAEKLRRYWTVGEGGAKIAWNTPGDFTRCTKFLSEHMTPERAKGYCANRHKEMTGMWPGDKDNKAVLDAYDPTYEAKAASPAPLDTKGAYPTLPGSYQERLTAVECAVREALRGEPVNDDGDRYEWDYVSIDGTFPDEVIATRIKWDAEQRQSFVMPYSLDGETVVLGEPEQVELELSVVPLADEPDYDEDDVPSYAETMPLAESVYIVASALHGAAMEGKAGRVLSGANERRLRSAVLALIRVLSAAGVEIDPADAEGMDLPAAAPNKPRTSDPRKDPDPSSDLTTTAPAAHKDAQVELDFADVQAKIAALRAAAE